MNKSNKTKLITTHMQLKRSYFASVLSNKHYNATGFSADNAGDCEELMLRKTGKPRENISLRLQLHRYVSSAVAEHSIPDRNTMHFRGPLSLLTDSRGSFIRRNRLKFEANTYLRYNAIPTGGIYERYKGQI
jgi:hypothetical protein